MAEYAPFLAGPVPIFARKYRRSKVHGYDAFVFGRGDEGGEGVTGPPGQARRRGTTDDYIVA